MHEKYERECSGSKMQKRKSPGEKKKLNESRPRPFAKLLPAKREPLTPMQFLAVELERHISHEAFKMCDIITPSYFC